MGKLIQEVNKKSGDGHEAIGKKIEDIL